MTDCRVLSGCEGVRHGRKWVCGYKDSEEQRAVSEPSQDRTAVVGTDEQIWLWLKVLHRSVQSFVYGNVIWPNHSSRWLDGVVVRTLDLQVSRRWFESLPGYFWDRGSHFTGELSWNITTIQVNSALHPSRVAKLSTSFGWGKSGKVTAAG